MTQRLRLLGAAVLLVFARASLAVSAAEQGLRDVDAAWLSVPAEDEIH